MKTQFEKKGSYSHHIVRLMELMILNRSEVCGCQCASLFQDCLNHTIFEQKT